ncbi:uncharacterized protein LOC128223937 isoform X3 [Mya arenaria]|uniref:uncharacterized protein LOC128223937 isoform X3 n=1 Tax=Mya arenaria TaxID=6604 RepID=UPI0022E7CFF5|nr:uncharacterized protein LOC128223937 isoform X3 [Mya arenaria]
MPCSWQKEDYFALLMSTDKKSFSALEMLVDDLHADKEKTVTKFLCHSGSEDFLWGLVHLLGNDTARVAGNAAYILGTLAESEIGCVRVLSLVNQGSGESRKILPHLTRMLTFDDSESVMNAAGTMGTLAESAEGREWILSERCLPQTIDHITALLHSDNLWTASNAALVLARLSISEQGCSRVLEHEHSTHILSKLILSLGVDEAGRGMNAAFAIGRLCDMDQGRKRLLQLNDSERMISALAKMLCCDDTGASKNSCFALSCLATNAEGHSRLLGNVHSEDILKTLASLLCAEDSETGWFAAMTLRTLASQPKGCLRLREHPQVISGLKGIESKEDINPDLKEEAIITLEILKRLSKPSPPNVIVVSSTQIKASWEPLSTKSGFQIRYQLFDSSKCVYTGKQCECEISGLTPNTPYTYKLRAYTDGDESPFSDIVAALTEEDVPGPPQSVRILGTTITQLKVGWDPPAEINGALKGYYVFLDDKEVQHTTDTSVILTGLTANTSYELEVCAATSKGRGDRAGIIGTTAEMGAHAPSKPHVNVVGRNELYISWGPPEVPLGRLNRYDVIMNDKIIYSGNDLNYPVRRLVPDTEYSFVIVALTSEGKFESKTTRKRTAKDEYDQARPPLYQPPKKEATEDNIKVTPGQPANQKRRKSSATRVSSAKLKQRGGTGKERVKSSTAPVENRPPSVSSTVSIQDHTLNLPASTRPPEKSKSPSPLPSPVQKSPALESTPSPRVQRPVAEIKMESPPPKPKTPRATTRPERGSTSAGIQPRAVLSTVSMQNNNKQENNGESGKPMEATVSGTKIVSKNAPIQNNLGKMERSKTTMNGGREYRKGKYSGSVQNRGERNDSDVKGSMELPEASRTRERSRPNTNDREHNTMSVSSNRKSKQEVEHYSSNTCTVHDTDRVEKDKFCFTTPDISRERSSKVKGHGVSRTSADRSKGSKDAVLPKPLPPSQQYLMDAGNTYGDKSSPQSKAESDWLSQVKSVSDNLSRPPQAQLPVFHESADSTYFIDQSQYLQRTNTYVSSHRHQILEPIRKKDYPTHPALGNAAHPVLSPIQEHIPNVLRRPTIGGRRSLEKLQPSRMTSNAKVAMPAKSGQFDLDIPDTSSKLANKFIPMQLRTQPSNLGMGQLQRMNTTLMGDLTASNSVSFRRFEAMTRSHTLMEMRQSQPLPNTSDIPMENRRDLVLPAKERGAGASRRLSGSPGKAHKLGSSPGMGTHRTGEPDSMLLQQSWGLNSSSDLGALQNVR